MALTRARSLVWVAPFHLLRNRNEDAMTLRWPLWIRLHLVTVRPLFPHSSLFCSLRPFILFSISSPFVPKLSFSCRWLSPESDSQRKTCTCGALLARAHNFDARASKQAYESTSKKASKASKSAAWKMKPSGNCREQVSPSFWSASS